MTLFIRDIAGSDVANATSHGIGEVIKRAREAVGYSLEDLAETCGLTTDEITSIEIGSDTDEQRVRRAAAALKISAIEPGRLM